MFQLSNLHFLAIVVVDIFVMAGLLRAARRHFNISLSVLAAATIFTLQLTAVIFFIGIPLNEINIHVDNTNLKSVSTYTMDKTGIVSESRHKRRFRRINTRASADRSFSTFDSEDRKYAIKFGDNPASFSITEMSINALLPWAKKHILNIRGKQLFNTLYAPIPNINVNYLKNNKLVNALTEKNEPGWIELPIHLRANHAMWRISDKLSLLLIAASWSISIAAGVFITVLVPISPAQARAYAKGELNTKTSRLSYYVFNTLIMIIVLIIMLIFGEYLLRYYFKDVLSSPTSITYFHAKHNPNFVAENNTLGYRGAEFSLEKDHRFRVVVMGDSFSWGQGVYPYTERFPEKLEGLFNQAAGQEIEVINLGRAGLGLPQYAKFLPSVLALKPDFILYQWYINDMDVWQKDSLPRPLRPIIPIKPLHDYIYKRSVLYYLIEMATAKYRTPSKKDNSYTQYLQNKYSLDGSEGRNNSLLALQQVFSQINSSGVDFGVVLFPDTGSLANIDKYKFGFLHDIVLGECTKQAIPCLDLRSAYSHFDDRMKETWVNVLDAHPSAAVHSLAAKEILDYFGTTWRKMISGKPSQNIDDKH